MQQNGANFDCYSINGNSIFEGFGIEPRGNIFVWYYTERGAKNVIKTFPTEEEIIAYAYSQIKSDKWAWMHCIGFTSDKLKAAELVDTLIKMQIEYFKDEIPYYGINRPVYRIFVVGCDFEKTAFLKKEYWTEK